MPDSDGSVGKKVRIVYLIARVHHALRATRLEPALKFAGITPLQYTILTVVARHERLSSAELSRRFYVTPQTMGKVLGNLQERGLLRRREDPDNRRVLRVELTAKGTRLVEQCDGGIDEVEREIFGDDRDADFLRRKLSEIADYLRGGSPEAAGNPVPAPARRGRRTPKP